MQPSPVIRRFKFFCIAEGISWIILLAAMAVKYGMNEPGAVKVPGWIHGALFVGYGITAIPLFTQLKWPIERMYGVALAGFFPFGTFVLERKWLR